MRKRLIGLMVPFLIGIVPTPANAATIWYGTCELTVTFNFASAVKMSGTRPSYTISISPGPVVDYNPVNWSGQQPCAVAPDGVDPARSTFLTANDGQSSEWSCSAVLATGNWGQSWRDINNNSGPGPISGAHSVAGTWGNWVMYMETVSQDFLSVMTLQLHPDEIGKLDACDGSGFTSLKMIGVQVFEDPSLAR